MINEELDVNAMQASIKQAKKTYADLLKMSNENAMLRQELNPKIEEVNKLVQSLGLILSKDTKDKKAATGAGVGTGGNLQKKAAPVATPPTIPTTTSPAAPATKQNV